MRVFGVDFAPLWVPLERRLQVVSVLFYVNCFLIFPIVFTIGTILLLLTSYYWVVLGYLIWFVYDVYIEKTASKGGRRSEWLRNAKHMHYFRDYFPLHLVKTANLSQHKNYIFATHPHGILCCSLFGNFASEATGFSKLFPGIRPHLLTLAQNFRWPLLRGYILWMGCCSVSRESIQWLTTRQGQGNAAVIIVGGAEEALEARPGNYRLTLKNRKGFVKMAMRTGASLVPVFSFGENDLYEQADNPHGSRLRAFQEKIKAITGFTPPVFYGRGLFNYTFGVIPRRRPVYTVVGRPIDVIQDPNPSKVLVDSYHERYMEELRSLFNEHKTKYGVPETTQLVMT